MSWNRVGPSKCLSGSDGIGESSFSNGSTLVPPDYTETVPAGTFWLHRSDQKGLSLT